MSGFNIEVDSTMMWPTSEYAHVPMHSDDASFISNMNDMVNRINHGNDLQNDSNVSNGSSFPSPSMLSTSIRNILSEEDVVDSVPYVTKVPCRLEESLPKESKWIHQRSINKREISEKEDTKISVNSETNDDYKDADPTTSALSGVKLERRVTFDDCTTVYEEKPLSIVEYVHDLVDSEIELARLKALETFMSKHECFDAQDAHIVGEQRAKVQSNMFRTESVLSSFDSKHQMLASMHKIVEQRIRYLELAEQKGLINPLSDLYSSFVKRQVTFLNNVIEAQNLLQEEHDKQ